MMSSHHQHNGRRRLTVLVDMDGVMCDFEGYMLDQFRKKYPECPYVKPDERRTFYMADQYDCIQPGLGEKLREIMREPGFFGNLPPIPGAVEAIKEMAQIDGVDVFFCTAPISLPFYCVPEKYEWINRYFGSKWMMRVILTQDKTLVHGDILIDDNHEIKGLHAQPSWNHVIFSQCHNLHLPLNGKSKFTDRLNCWTDGSWQSIIDSYYQRLVRHGSSS